MELAEIETPRDRAIKLDCLRAYSDRLRRREDVKAFAVSRGLVSYPHQSDCLRSRTQDESELRAKLRPVERFFDCPSSYEELVGLLLSEKRLLGRLNQISSSNEPKDEMLDYKQESSCPVKSSRGLESRKARILEDDVAKITEIYRYESTRNDLKTQLSDAEVSAVQSMITPENFGYARELLLKRARNASVHSARVTLDKFGHTTRISITKSPFSNNDEEL